ncbi:MAG TPA: hypothetical protein VLV78_23535 [Thermoanaerobaculia bacterium]|nr:hypothetical protein [Thermoanaerobaculia bacterium]
MFEDLTPNKGEQGLIRAERIFLILAVLAGLVFVIDLLRFVSGSPVPLRTLTQVLVAGVLAVFTARGIEAQRPWAKWLGYAQGVLSLFSFPVGTVIGIAVLIYIYRASKAGLFSQTPPVVKPA